MNRQSRQHQAMENVQEKHLTLEDKAKLKERLALLKKEYKRTINRLQKSERAERVKTHVKRTIEEQNRLLSQEDTEQDNALLSAGLENFTSNASGDLGESYKNFETSSEDKERKACVSFNLEPVIVNSDSRTPPCSGCESSGQEAEGNRPHQSNQISRSRLRLRRSARRVCFSESLPPSAFCVSSVVNVSDGKESTVDKSLSPVFKSHPTDGTPLRPDNPTANCCSQDTKHEDVALEIAGPSGTTLLPLGNADNSLGEVKSNANILHSVDAEINTTNELVQHWVENAFSKPETGEQPLSTSKSVDVETTCNPTCGPLVTPPRKHIDLMTSQPRPSQSSPNLPPQKFKIHADHTVIQEDHDLLSSCTLVDGLLFPVEYYVRTTRRMTSCQRKVDLDAVISSHLGTGRRGSKGRSRRNSISSSTPVNTSDKLGNSLTPLSRPSVSNSAREFTRSRRGRGRKSCPAVFSSGLKNLTVQLKFDAAKHQENSQTPSGSQSEKENCDEALASKSHHAVKCLTNVNDGSQIKEVETFRILRSAKRAYSLGSPEATAAGDEDSKLCNFKSPKEASEPTGSSLALLRVDLEDHLSHYLKITDFHLPDEDFGILKLEKLKSVNHQRLFTPHLLRERSKWSQHSKNGSHTVPPADSSVELQRVDLEACSPKSESALNLLKTKEHCSNFDLPPCSEESTLRKNIEKSTDAEIPLLSQLSPVKNGVFSISCSNVDHPPFSEESTLGNNIEKSTDAEIPLLSQLSPIKNGAFSISCSNVDHPPSSEERTLGNNIEKSTDAEIPLISQLSPIKNGGFSISCSNVDHPFSKESTLGNNIEKSTDAEILLLSQLSPVKNQVVDAKLKISHSPKKDFLFSPPCDDDNPNYTSSIPERPFPDDEMPQTIFPNAAGSLSDGEVHPCIPLTEVSGAAQGLGTNLDFWRSIESNDVPTDSPTESTMLGKLSCPKELNSSVPFLTSLCSVPLETVNDSVALSYTPVLPCLGPTPAVFSSPRGSNTSVSRRPEEERQDTVFHLEVCGGEGPEFMSLSCLDITGDTADTGQCHPVLGKDNSTVVHCEYLEQEKSLLSKTDQDRSVHVIPEGADNEDTEVGSVSQGHLHLLSEVKDSCGGGCVVDVCPVWWDFSGSPELCIVSASESSIYLWRPQTEGNWDCAHSWSFTEMPVIQILPFSQEKNIVCVALGNLEIMEIWALFSPLERLGWEKQLVKHGHMKTAHGLSRHRLVSSGIGEDGQVVEVQQLSETGSTVDSLSLVPPRDSVQAFCEVEGERDALVGSTMDTYVVVWNAVTGHLLSVICVGAHCADLTCLNAASDSGLLFLVVRSLFSKPCDDAGSCMFKLVVVNPQGGASSLIMNYFIPDKPSSRYLEGDVKRHKAAAVLTCGSIALWDLPSSHCSVTLPPSSDAPWCLVRWSHTPSCLLAGKKDGSICIYEYTKRCSNKR